MPACLHSLTHTAPLNPSTIRKASLFSRLLDLASAGPSRCKHGDPSRPKEDREDLLCAIEGSERRRSDLRTGNRVEVGCPARERVGATLSFCPGHQHTPAAHNPKPGIGAFIGPATRSIASRSCSDWLLHSFSRVVVPSLWQVVAGSQEER